MIPIINILYIDDDLIDRKAFERLCKRTEYINCLLAESLEEALSLREKTNFDLIISDVYLQKSTAFNVLDSFDTEPVCIVSGIHDPERWEIMKKRGARGSLLKPVREEKLGELIRAIIKTKDD